jgi:hypothetical protein
MNAKDAIKGSLIGTQQVLEMYLADLSDADLLVRPVPNANHIAWQLGHLIVSEHKTALGHLGGAPELPAGFAEQHTKATAMADPPKGFGTKEQYLGLFKKIRSATIAGLAKLPEADLDKPVTGDVARLAPTVGALLVLMGNHTMMHAGQFSVVRRKLGKPVLF